MKNLFIAFALVLFTACSSDDAPKDYTAENDQEIQAYIADNNLTAQKSNSGLYYIIEEQGTGDKPTTLDDRVKVAYKGYLTDGTVFEDNEDGNFPSLNGLILGWIEGLSYFNEGGKGKLIIPAHLAFGDSGNGQIPAGAVVIFDIELIYVNYKTENDEQILAYITEKDVLAEKTDSGLYYTINTLGDGIQPTLTDNVTVTYKGYFTNDNTFDESSENINFNLEGLILGFSEGMTYLNEGGSGTFFVPSHLAYGNVGTSGIPPGAVVIFDVELISVN